MRFSLLIFCLTLLLNSMPAHAHHGAEGAFSGPGISGPIITIPARTMPKGRFFAGAGINYTNFDAFSDQSLISLDRKGEHIHDPGHIFIPYFNFGYGITDDFFAGLIVPYVFRYDIRTAFAGMAVEQGNSIGIGDIVLFSEYRFLKNLKHDFHASLISGIKIPSGVRRDTDRQGLRFETDDQPGTGSWDPLVGLALSKTVKSFSIDSNATYRFSTEGAQNTTVGDVANFNVAVSHRVKNKRLRKMFIDHLFGRDLAWDLILEANGSWIEKPAIKRDRPLGHDSVRSENHGGLLIYLTPGIRLTFDNKWITNLAVGLPVIEDLNGRQRAPDVKLVFGLTRVF